ncbi:MAG: hypothetical protein ACI4CZ_01675 [Hominisplanchenecus sp.]
MKRSVSKIIMNMFLLLTMAFMIPSIAKAAPITSSGGDGKEATPHQLTIGHCEDDTFTYTVSSGFSYLRVTFTKPAEVSCSFAENGPWVLIQRPGISASSLSGDSFLVKQGETVTLIIRSGSNSIPIHFTSIPLSDTSLYCPESAVGKHAFAASHGSECRYGCGYTCPHPKSARDYYNEYSWLSNRQHAQYFECEICEQKTYDASEATACTLGTRIPDNNFPRHYASCTVCDNEYSDDCIFNSRQYIPRAWNTHMVNAICSLCGKVRAGTVQNHNFKNNKCTQCGFVRVVPSQVKVTYVKQSGKVKTRKIYHEAHWVKNSYNQWVWQRAFTTKVYDYKIKIKYKKAKNAERYIISTSNNIDASILYLYQAGKNKTSVTCTYSNSKKKSKVTLYVIPVSKTGTPGKAVKKVVKLKN